MKNVVVISQQSHYIPDHLFSICIPGTCFFCYNLITQLEPCHYIHSNNGKIIFLFHHSMLKNQNQWCPLRNLEINFLGCIWSLLEDAPFFWLNWNNILFSSSLIIDIYIWHLKEMERQIYQYEVTKACSWQGVAQVYVHIMPFCPFVLS